MQRMIPFLIILLFITSAILSCANADSEKVIESDTENLTAVSEETLLESYAVVWKWATSLEDRVVEHAPAMTAEIQTLWEQGVIENVYYDSSPEEVSFANFPNVTFFIKAENKSEAESILNELTAKKEFISYYILHPVGDLWMGINEDVLVENVGSKSYVSIWSNTGETYDEDRLKEQEAIVVNLWNEGRIENIYLKSATDSNDESDFVFFINADSEDEAKILCESLPFYQDNIATYEIHQVGVNWMGVSEEN